ncbi:hypothetical protein LSM04_006542 [Trypanosoma melophagium]|uniref:uncharacterized protein n=1 Tax=Trypanosoma melophagium TaxID=715481 RepID=UPI003519DE9E|nr:hypothetical protein LSM04_006542 [Trypanosoma melophagium]
MGHSSTTVCDATLVVLITVCTLISHILSLVWWHIVPHLFYPEERRLEERIAQLRAEAELCASSDHLHLHGKLTREAQMLMKELARARQQRYVLCRCYKNKQQQKSGDADKEGVLQYFIAWFRCMLPRLVGGFISCGFMIPILYWYGSQSIVVVFPQHFSTLMLLVVYWMEKFVMMLLLSPFMLGVTTNVEKEMCHTGNWDHSTKGGEPASFGVSNSDNNNHNHNHMMMMSDSGTGENIRSVSVSPSASTGGCVDDEVHGMGVFLWFLACFVAVRFTHRVLARA